MKKIIKNYKSTIILLISLLLGLLLGLILKEKAKYLKPFGDLFINLLCTLIIPIIFTSVTSSIGSINQKRLKTIIKNTIIIFAIMSVICALTGVLVTKSFKLVNANVNTTINSVTNEKINILDKTVSLISVNDFYKLLSKENMIALLVISIIFGICVNKNKDNKKILNVLGKLNELIMQMLAIVMKYAPIGICAFFASQIGELGLNISKGYLKVFIIYTITCLLFAGIIYSICAKICNKSIKTFWKEAMPVIVTSLSTCSSAACIPVNIKACKNLEIDNEIGSTSVTLGTSFHKQGSIIDSVFKIMFLVYLFNKPISFLTILFASILVTFLISAVPIGGGTLCEMMIISLFGFPIESLMILTIIATITDAPATMLNALGNTSNALLINKLSKKNLQH